MNELFKVTLNVAGQSLVQQLLSKDTNTSNFVKPKNPTGLKATSFSIKDQDLYALHDYRGFAKANQDLLYAISKSDSAKQVLSKTKISSRDDLVKIVSQAAYDAVKNNAGIPSDLKTQFQQDPSYAALVLANVGGIQDLLKKEDVSKVLFSSTSGENEIFTELATKAASLFKDDNSLHDVSFFENHVNAAIYVLTKPDLVKSFNKGDDASLASALAFKNNAARPDQAQLFQDTAVSLAQNSVNRVTYSQSFFQDNPELTQFVVAGDLLNLDTKASELLKNDLHYRLNNIALGDRFNFSELVNNTLSQDAAAKLGKNSPLGTSFLKTHYGLTQLIRNNETFRTNLKSVDSNKPLQVIFQQKDAPDSKDFKEVMASLQKNFNSGRAVSYVV